MLYFFLYSICLVSRAFESSVFQNCSHKIMNVPILFALDSWPALHKSNFFLPLHWACSPENNSFDIKCNKMAGEMCSYNASRESLVHRANAYQTTDTCIFEKENI